MKNYSNGVAEITTQLEQVRILRYELKKSNDLKVQEVFDNAFNYFKELTIKVSGDSASFHLEDGDRNKEIFSINFYERYRGDVELSLSYYSTNTNSEFELSRLIFLGKAAQIVRSNSERILQDIADVRKRDKERDSELYALEDSYEKRLSEIRNVELADRKVQIELSLKSDGITFSTPVYFTLKRNYDPRINFIKILETSKSGKTCTVQYINTGGSTGREERVDVKSVLNQVAFKSKNIV